MVLGVGLIALVEAFVRWHRTRIYLVGGVLIDEDEGDCEDARILGWYNTEKDAERAISRSPHGFFLRSKVEPRPPRFSHAVLEVHAEGDAMTDPVETRWYATEERDGKTQVHRVKRPADISDFWCLARTHW